MCFFHLSIDRFRSPKDLVNAFQHRAGAVNAPHAGHAPAPCAAQARGRGSLMGFSMEKMGESWWVPSGKHTKNELERSTIFHG